MRREQLSGAPCSIRLNASEAVPALLSYKLKAIIVEMRLDL